MCSTVCAAAAAGTIPASAFLCSAAGSRATRRFVAVPNDRPIRLYGVIPIKVTDPATKLAPVLTAANEWAPQSKATFTVSEGSGRAMDYTVAVVDEGLLGLTNFKTPNLFAEFYKRGQSYEVERLINTVKGPRLFLFRNKFVTSGSGEKRVYLICSGTDITASPSRTRALLSAWSRIASRR